MQQMELKFSGGLVEDYDRLMDLMKARIEASGRLKKQVAADMDISPSKLSRCLPGGDLNFSVDMLERYIEITGDLDPIYYLAERFVPRDKPDPLQMMADLQERQKRRDEQEAKDRQTMEQILNLLSAQKDDKLRVVK